MNPTTGQDSRKLARYEHTRPTPFWRARCSARCPDTSRACTLGRHHTGPHIAHGLLRKPVAVWHGESGARRPQSRVAGKVDRRAGAAPRKARAASSLEGLWRRVAGLPSHLEEIFLLVFFLAFLWFVVDWAIRIAAGG